MRHQNGNESTIIMKFLNTMNNYILLFKSINEVFKLHTLTNRVMAYKFRVFENYLILLWITYDSGSLNSFRILFPSVVFKMVAVIS